MTMTDSIPIQPGDYLIRSDRVLQVLETIGDGDQKAYAVAKVEGARVVDGKILLPSAPAILGRKSTLRAATLVRDCRYLHVRAADVTHEAAIEETADLPPPVEPARVPTGEDLQRELLEALKRCAQMMGHVVVSLDLLREAIGQQKTRGQLELPRLAKAS